MPRPAAASPSSRPTPVLSHPPLSSARSPMSSSLALDQLVQLYSFLAVWKQLALSGRAPAGLLDGSGGERVRRPRTPHVALLHELLSFLRSRACVRERLRSVVRWQLLYSSEMIDGRGGPRTALQVSCLTHAQHGWREAEFYESAAEAALCRAARERMLGHLFRSLVRWRSFVRHRLRSPLSLLSRAFVAWAALAPEAARLHAAALRLLDRLSPSLASRGCRKPLRRWRRRAAARRLLAAAWRHAAGARLRQWRLGARALAACRRALLFSAVRAAHAALSHAHRQWREFLRARAKLRSLLAIARRRQAPWALRAAADGWRAGASRRAALQHATATLRARRRAEAMEAWRAAAAARRRGAQMAAGAARRHARGALRRALGAWAAASRRAGGVLARLEEWRRGAGERALARLRRRTSRRARLCRALGQMLLCVGSHAQRHTLRAWRAYAAWDDAALRLAAAADERQSARRVLRRWRRRGLAAAAAAADLLAAAAAAARRAGTAGFAAWRARGPSLRAAWRRAARAEERRVAACVRLWAAWSVRRARGERICWLAARAWWPAAATLSWRRWVAHATRRAAGAIISRRLLRRRCSFLLAKWYHRVDLRVGARIRLAACERRTAKSRFIRRWSKKAALRRACSADANWQLLLLLRMLRAWVTASIAAAAARRAVALRSHSRRAASRSLLAWRARALCSRLGAAALAAAASLTAPPSLRLAFRRLAAAARRRRHAAAAFRQPRRAALLRWSAAAAAGGARAAACRRATRRRHARAARGALEAWRHAAAAAAAAAWGEARAAEYFAWRGRRDKLRAWRAARGEARRRAAARAWMARAAAWARMKVRQRRLDARRVPPPRRVARHARLAAAAAAMRRWGERAADRCERAHLFQRSDRRRAAHALRALLRWVDVALHAKLLLGSALLAWRGRTRHLAFLAWADASRRRHAAERRARQRRGGALALALRRWAASGAEGARHTRLVGGQRLVAMLKARGAAFERWRRFAAAARRRRRRRAAAAEAALSDAVERWAAAAAARAEAAAEAALRRQLEALVRWRSLLAVRPDKGWERRGGGGAARGGAPPLVEVLVFGAGGFGQLGSGAEEDVLTPSVLPGLGQLHIQAAACGEYHSALLTADGEVYTFGVGEFGVLGHGSEGKSSIPRRVERLVGEHVVSVACGWRHTAARTLQQALYTWGHGGFGQLGHGGTINFFLPLRLETCKKWVQVSCGWRHTAALAAGDETYTWGDGEQMQLGHGDRSMAARPKEVTALSAAGVLQVECGTHHCIAATEAGEVYTWGSGSHGQLGHGDRRSEAVPRRVSALSGVRVVRVACGGHSLALAIEGKLYSWGNGNHGQLGHGVCRPECSPRLVEALDGVRVIGVACGDFHTLALTEEERVYTWGSGAFGELGHATLSHQPLPRALSNVDGVGLLHAACGASHNVLLVRKADSIEGSD
ncbi:hypothetical protein AB1Y20_007930 [Prymnesium parvum]|uniref:RCC1-like domain-containing protein n=1 Tax=Prymnesium parvum TaxID=97485 RepID=A0AB34IV51_PRYPA